MNALALYLIKASLSLALFYIVYWVFLRKETLFVTTRYYLVGSLFLSLILPLISLNYTVRVTGDVFQKNNAATIFDTGLFSHSGVQEGTGGLAILTIIYLTGVTIFFFRIILQFILLYRLIAKSEITFSNGTKIIYNSRFLMPFSFMNYVFINPDQIRESEFGDIIAHEEIHIRERHWLDLLIVELMSIILWFNPVIWFFERSIKQNHEYLADEGVIAQGYNVGRYHSVLINQLLGMEVIGITNNLNYSLNAKRLKMMKKTKTPKARALNIIWALPVIILLLAAFARPQYVSSEPAENLAAASLEATVQLRATVLDSNGDAIPGATVKVKGTSAGTVTDKTGSFVLDLKPTDVVIISMMGYDDTVIEMKKIVAKQGDSENYAIKVKMSTPGEAAKLAKEKEAGSSKVATAKSGEPTSEEMVKNLEETLKKLEMKKASLEDTKKKIAQAEQEGSIDKAELEKKKIALKEEMTAVNEKMDIVRKKLQTLKN